METPRLTLRQFTEDDADSRFDLNSDPEVMRYLTGPRGDPGTRSSPSRLAVYDRHDRPGTWAAQSTDITNIDLGVQRAFAHTMTVNTASRRVMEKCGSTSSLRPNGNPPRLTTPAASPCAGLPAQPRLPAPGRLVKRGACTCQAEG
jgi:RimJ/RimL family protein N-acetyltransferase